MTEALSLKVIAHYNWGNSDNAGDAQKEIQLTFTKMTDLLEESNDPEIRDMKKLYGFNRLPISFGDLFHINNLIVTWASNIAFGETERGNHSEVHHCQLLQSLFDLVSHDRDFAQRLLNEVIAATPIDGKIVICLLYTSPSPRDLSTSRMPSSA